MIRQEYEKRPEVWEGPRGLEWQQGMRVPKPIRPTKGGLVDHDRESAANYAALATCL